MSRINTNISSLIAQRVLTKNNQDLQTSLQRLSTGLRINSGADDPAGLIASENLKAEQVGINTAISNASRANTIIGTAEGGLSEVSSLLTQLQGLVGQAANSGGLSSEEIAASQLQVDSILTTINRVAGSTSFEGMKLLNGNLAYTTSGVTATSLGNVNVNTASQPAGAAQDVVIAVSQSAQTAKVTYTGGAVPATSTVTIEITGNQGTQQLSFGGGATLANIASAVNGVKLATGVSAVVSGANVVMQSTDFGSKQFVSVQTVAGTFTTDVTKATGRDAKVTVNGAAAQADGLTVNYRSASLDLSFDIQSGLNVTNGQSSFYITGGGAKFALGSKVTESDKASIGISSVSTGSLGNATLGFLSTLASGQSNSLSSSNLVTAQNIVNTAIKQVSTLRGRLGAFQKFTIGSTINSLGVAYENATAAQSAISDTDFAQETSNLTRSQIMASAATTVLAQANSSPQLALKLLQ